MIPTRGLTGAKLETAPRSADGCVQSTGNREATSAVDERAEDVGSVGKRYRDDDGSVIGDAVRAVIALSPGVPIPAGPRPTTPCS